MVKIVRTPTDSLPDESRGLSEVGVVQHAGAGPGGEARIVEQRDGTHARFPEDPSDIAVLPTMTPMGLERHLDTIAALQIACYRILMGMEIYQFDLEALLATQDLQGRKLELQRVFFDHPRNEDELDPMPSATILQSGDESYQYQARDTQILEETVDVYAPETVLRKLATAQVMLDLVIWSAHKEERRAIKAAIQRSFLAEPDDLRPGRRIVVPEYYDRVARLDLQNCNYPDSQDSAQANQWILQARFAADVDVVLLVKRPSYLKPPIVDARVTTGDLDDL